MRCPDPVTIPDAASVTGPVTGLAVGPAAGPAARPAAAPASGRTGTRAVGVAAGTGGPGGRDPDRAVPVRRFRVFGCLAELAWHGRPALSVAEVVWRLRALDRRFSRFDPGSELSRFNAAAGEWAPVSAELGRLLRHALTVAVESRGLVNVAVLPRLVAAGYTDRWPAPLRTPRPDPASDPESDPSGRCGRADWSGRPGVRPVEPLTAVLEVGPGRARLRPGHAVDLGGLAKGLWADDVVGWLGGNAVCGLGGDVACAGPGPDGSGWPVSLPGGDVLLVTDGGVATSGTGRRRWAGGHHLIDPRTGLPAASGVAEASVLAGCAATADWVATAAVVGGAGAAERLRARPDVYLCRLREAHGGVDRAG